MVALGSACVVCLRHGRIQISKEWSSLWDRVVLSAALINSDHLMDMFWRHQQLRSHLQESQQPHASHPYALMDCRLIMKN